MTNIDFSTWLQAELDRRSWIQADLLTSAKARGYSITSPQLSRILSREQQAGIDSVIAIAHGLGISREVVFHARGWLLTNTPDSTYEPDLETRTLMQELEALPPTLRLIAKRTTRSLVDTLKEIAQEQG